VVYVLVGKGQAKVITAWDMDYKENDKIRVFPLTGREHPNQQYPHIYL
jgi:hypothetical protein